MVSMCHGIGPASRTARSKSGPEPGSGRIGRKGVHARCTGTEIFLRERWLTGTRRSGRSLEGVQLDAGVGEKVRTGGKRKDVRKE